MAQGIKFNLENEEHLYCLIDQKEVDDLEGFGYAGKLQHAQLSRKQINQHNTLNNENTAR